MAQRFSGDGFLDPEAERELVWVRMTAVGLGTIALACAVSERILVALMSKPAIFLFPLAAFFFVFAYRVEFGALNRLYIHVIKEDGPIEMASAVFFAVASVLFLCVAYSARSRKRKTMLFFCGLGGLMAWVALEEISYGQRLFDWQGPAFIVAANSQVEVNIHNLYALGGFTKRIAPGLVALYGCLGWLLVRAYRQRWGRSAGQRSEYEAFFAPWFASSYFAVLFVFVIANSAYSHDHWLTFRDQELAEFFLSLGFILFASARFHEFVLRADEAQYGY